MCSDIEHERQIQQILHCLLSLQTKLVSFRMSAAIKAGFNPGDLNQLGFHTYELLKSELGAMFYSVYKDDNVDHMYTLYEVEECEQQDSSKFFSSVEKWLQQPPHSSIIPPLHRYKDNNYVCIVWDHIWRNKMHGGVYNLEQVRSVVKQLLEVVEFIHSHGLIHGNINPSTIYLDGTQVLLGDVSTVIACTDAMINRYTDNNLDLAPEIQALRYATISSDIALLEQHARMNAVDVYGIGITAISLLFGMHPFAHSSDDHIDKVFRRIQNNQSLISQSQWSSVPDGVASLLKSMVDSNPMNRPTISSVLQHTWIIENTK